MFYHFLAFTHLMCVAHAQVTSSNSLQTMDTLAKARTSTSASAPSLRPPRANVVAAKAVEPPCAHVWKIIKE